MADLDGGRDEGVSLFPMFNILACTLGVMVFILATVATVSLGADKTVELLSTEVPGAPQLRSPTWVEWDGEEMVMHPSLARVSFDRALEGIPTFEQTYTYMFDQLAGNPIGGELAAVAQDNRNRYVILLVRPSGFASVPEVEGYLDLLGITVVPEPIDQSWRRVRVR